jgi:AcrR family transcriptional regulator
MTVDEVAADVGIAKASLYKHFVSKEELAAAAMVRVLDRTLTFLADLDRRLAGASALERLKAVVRWTMEVQLAGQMPLLPSQNSTLRAALMGNQAYVDRLFDVGERLGSLIQTAQDEGHLSRALPAEVVLYTLYARACDPVLGMLKASDQHSDEQIIEWLLGICFGGLQGA